jgi:hypothetical protein
VTQTTYRILPQSVINYAVEVTEPERAPRILFTCPTHTAADAWITEIERLSAAESRKKPGREPAVCASGSSMSGPVGRTEGLTGEQRPALASSDVAASEKARQNQLENLIGLSTVYRRTPETIITTAATA